jgi:hypothetical protein
MRLHSRRALERVGTPPTTVTHQPTFPGHIYARLPISANFAVIPKRLTIESPSIICNPPLHGALGCVLDARGSHPCSAEINKRQHPSGQVLRYGIRQNRPSARTPNVLNRQQAVVPAMRW